MKTRIITNIATSALIALGSLSSAQAQPVQPVQPVQQVQQARVEPQPLPLGDSVNKPVEYMNQQGTAELQERVLTQINDGLLNGSLTAADASKYKTELNKLNDQEAWYKSFNSEIPRALTEKDTVFLNELGSRLHPKPALTAHTANSLHGDVDVMIQNALADHHITSGDAERYYLRLAQIESNLESIKRSPGAADSQVKANAELSRMRAELSKK